MSGKETGRAPGGVREAMAIRRIPEDTRKSKGKGTKDKIIVRIAFSHSSYY
jgi:hypothetical protein